MNVWTSLCYLSAGIPKEVVKLQRDDILLELETLGNVSIVFCRGRVFKTRVITERIVRLLGDGGEEP